MKKIGDFIGKYMAVIVLAIILVSLQSENYFGA